MYEFPTPPTPQYPFEVSSEFKTLKTDMESGKQQRRKVWSLPRRTIKLNFEALTQTAIDTLWNFYSARYGSFEPFWFFDLFSASHSGEYVGRGDGATTIFELPSKTTTGLTVYVNNLATQISFLSGGGEGGTDRIQFSVTGNITSSSVANPTVITTDAAHGLTTGNIVTIAGHTGSTPAISGAYAVTVLTTTTFSIPVNVTVGGTGGTWTVGAPALGAMITADFEGIVRYRVCFKEDKLSKSLFAARLYNCGIEIQEVRA